MTALRLTRLVGSVSVFVAAVVTSAVIPGRVPLKAMEPAIGWNNPRHAYIITSQMASTMWYVSELPLDKNPSQTRILGDR